MQKPSFILGAALLLLAASPALASSQWEELHGCRLLPNESNDGDSFHAVHDGKEYIFKLYFVDCPETNDEYPDRLADQAEHFDTTPDRVKTIGRYAEAATAKLLSDGFMAVTRWQEAGGGSRLPRYYAFIFIEGQDPKVPADLNAVLVANGLARVHGLKAKPPGAESKAGDLRDHYDSLEAEARSEKVGAWGDGASVPTMALPSSDDVGGAGKPVSFGRKSEVLYQRDKSASERLRLDAPEDTVVKVIDYRTGRVMVVAWIAKNSFESRLWVGVPDGLYKIVYAQQVHEAADGEFYAGYYGKLRDPVEVRYDPPTSVNISIHDTEYPNVKSSAKEFGSFRPPR
jgi:endonuclease YncB( thermonuclease family)